MLTFLHSLVRFVQTTVAASQMSVLHIVFTARRSYASAVLGVVILSVRPSVCLSVCPSVCHTRAL